MAFGDYFEPIIGSSFDSLAAQRAGYAQMNNQTQRQNIDSQVRAQQEANSYFETLANQRQAAIDRDTQLALAAKQFDVQQQMAQADRARHDLEWSVNEARLTGALKERERQDAARNDFLNQKTQDAKKQNQDDLDQIAGVAKFLVPQFNEQGSKLDDAKSAFDQAQTDVLSTINDYQKKLGPKVTWNPKAGQFVSATKFPITDKDTAATVAEANDAVAAKNAALQSASDLYGTLQSNFQNLQGTATKYQLVPGKEGGKWTLFSKLHNKAFGPEEKTSGADYFGTQTASTSAADNPAADPSYFGDSGAASVPTTQTTTNAPPSLKDSIPVITSKEQYDSLQKGDKYYDANGNLRRKK